MLVRFILLVFQWILNGYHVVFGRKRSATQCAMSKVFDTLTYLQDNEFRAVSQLNDWFVSILWTDIYHNYQSYYGRVLVLIKLL